MRYLQRRGCSDSPRFAAELASDLISDAESRRNEDFSRDQNARPASTDTLMHDLNAYLILLVTYAEGLDTNKVVQTQGLDASYAARNASMFEQTHPCAESTNGVQGSAR